MLICRPAPEHPLPWRKHARQDGLIQVEAANGRCVATLGSAQHASADFIIASANAALELVREVER